MKTAWDLTRELITVMSDIDSVAEELNKNNNLSKQSILENKMNVLDTKFLSIVNELKSKEI